MQATSSGSETCGRHEPWIPFQLHRPTSASLKIRTHCLTCSYFFQNVLYVSFSLLSDTYLTLLISMHPKRNTIFQSLDVSHFGMSLTRKNPKIGTKLDNTLNNLVTFDFYITRESSWWSHSVLNNIFMWLFHNMYIRSFNHWMHKHI
jgi:hypothetical protein